SPPYEPPPKVRPGVARRLLGDRQNRLIALVAGLVLVLIAGPPATDWAKRRWQGEPSTPGPSARPPLEATSTTTDPTAPSANGGPGGAPRREAYELYQKGSVAEACDGYRALANRLGTTEVRKNLGSCLARLGRDATQANLTEQAIDYF